MRQRLFYLESGPDRASTKMENSVKKKYRNLNKKKLILDSALATQKISEYENMQLFVYRRWIFFLFVYRVERFIYDFNIQFDVCSVHVFPHKYSTIHKWLKCTLAKIVYLNLLEFNHVRGSFFSLLYVFVFLSFHHYQSTFRLILTLRSPRDESLNAHFFVDVVVVVKE